MANKEQMLEDYKKSLENLSTKELEIMEQDIIKEADALDKEAAEKVFVLKGEDGEPLKVTPRAHLGNYVNTFISRVEATWQHALVLKVIIDFWASKSNEIKFPILDNTLRLLGQVKYQGVADINNVVEVNKKFENIREEFVAFSDRLYEVAEKHQIILNELGLRKNGGNETQA